MNYQFKKNQTGWQCLGWRINLIDILTWLNAATRQLMGKSQYPRLEAQVILSHYFHKSRTWVLAHPETPIPELISEKLSLAISRLANGEPLPYITGKSEFFGFPISISPAVLIPRPETELMVEKAIQWLHANKSARFAADIGTGSGCIAISLAKTILSINMIAVDSSRAALRVARENILQHDLIDRITLIQGNLLDFSGVKMDLICANLPYIPTHKLKNIRPARFEPISALDGGQDGLRFTGELIEKSKQWLNENGLLLLEFETGQENHLIEIGQKYYPTEWLSVDKDLSGKPRLLSITRPYIS